MNFKPLLLSALLFAGSVAASSCSESPNDPGTTPTIEITIEEPSIQLNIGDVALLSWSVKPEDTAVEWSSSDETVASVKEGLVTAISAGVTIVKATAGGGTESASCIVTIKEDAAVGDFYFSDGTYGSSVPAGKKAIGVVFHVGDPTTQDAALGRDHPDCTHGLVVTAIQDYTPYMWQAGRKNFNSSTGPWIEQNAKEYVSPVSIWTKDTRRNVIAGYNNTMALKAFNDAPENAEWPVTALDALNFYEELSPAPKTSSGWFIPGTKELSLLYNSEYEGDVFDFNNSASGLCLKNRDIIDNSLLQISGDPLWFTDGSWAYDLWSSTDWDETNAYKIASNTGKIMGAYKDDEYGNQLVRAILAF